MTTPSDPSPDGATPPSPALPSKPERLVIEVNHQGTPVVRRCQADAHDGMSDSKRAVSGLAEVQDRVRAMVDTPEMRRLAEEVRRMEERTRSAMEPLARQATQVRKAMEPFAEQTAKVQREMERAFKESGVAGELDRIRESMAASGESTRAAVEAFDSERARMKSAASSQAAFESHSASSLLAGHTAFPSIRTWPDEEYRRISDDFPELTVRAEVERRQVERETIAAAVKDALRGAFPPEFVQAVMSAIAKADGGRSAPPPPKVIEFPAGFVGPTIQRKEVVRRFRDANLTPGLKGGEDLKGRLRTVKDNDPLWVLRPEGAGRAGRGYYLAAVEWVERAYREIPDLARVLSENAVCAVRRTVEEESKRVPPAALAAVYGPPRRKP